MLAIGAGEIALMPDEAVAVALQENRDLAAARFVVKQAEGRLRQAGLWPNPDLELARAKDTPFANEGENTFSAGFRQRFPITGRLQKAKAVARADVAMAMAEIRNRERLLAAEALARIRELLLFADQLRLLETNAVFLEQLVSVSEKRLAAAETAVTDVNIAKLELEKNRALQTQILAQRDVSAAELNRLLGREPDHPVQVRPPSQPVPFTTNIMSQALARRPDRQLAALAIDKGAAEVTLARAQRWEDWSVGFEYSRARSVFREPVKLDDTDNFIGFGVSVPLPLWNRNQGRIAEAQATRERAVAELSALELTILTEVQAAASRIQRLQPLLQRYQDAIKLSEQNIALLQKGYADGQTPITAVIQAQQQLSDLRRTFLETSAEYNRALIDWQTATATHPALK